MSPASDPPLRVCALISSLTWGGAEMLLADFAAGAPSAGIEFDVAYLQDRDGSPAADRLRRLGIDPTLVPITGLLKREDHQRVHAFLAARRPDVLHTHLGNADFLGGIAARRLGIPMVSTIHVMAWEGGRRERVKDRLMDVVRGTCGQATVTVSDSARAAFQGAGYGWRSEVVTLHNGVDARPVPGSGRAVREQLGISPEETVVTMVSVLREGKGHELAAQAVERLRREDPGVRLLVVGDGPFRDGVKAAMAVLGDGAVMAGHREDVMAVLDATDILLHPSHVDAFPTALLEGLSAGVPIVASSVGGIPEIVEHGVSGRLIGAPPSAEQAFEALSALTTDADLRARMGGAGRQRFEVEFSAGRWAGRTRELYDRILARRKN